MPTQNTNGGTINSFNNTPIAKDDQLRVSENDIGSTLYFDVMSNDLAGKAKSLWSLDNGQANDLLTQDLARTEATSFDTSRLGARIWITEDGKVGYDASALSSIVNALGAGETIEDSFVYAIRMANGTLSWATATICLVGVDDQSSVSGDTKGNVVEAGFQAEGTPRPGIPVATGHLTITDPDSVTAFLAADTVASQFGYGTFSITGDGTWTYTLDNSNPVVDALDENAKLTDQFTVQTTDGTTQTITITIYAASDFRYAATFTGTDDPNDFDDLVGVNPANGAATIAGTIGADDITGDATAQHIDAKGGDDTAYGGGGNDTLIGNTGNDRLYGQSGNDVLTGDAGLDGLYGGSGNDTVTGGNDTDHIYGGSGADFLNGLAGDDVIIGGFGADRLLGGTGSDTFRMVDLRDTNDSIADFQIGIDKLDLGALDADASTATDDAFVWGGTTRTAHGVWMVSDGQNTMIFADTDGNVDTAEFMVKVLTLSSVSADDLFL